MSLKCNLIKDTQRHRADLNRARGVHRSKTGPDRLDRRPKKRMMLDRRPDRSGAGPGPDRTGQNRDRTGSQQQCQFHTIWPGKPAES